MHSTTTARGEKWLAPVNGEQPQILGVLPDFMLIRFCGRILLIPPNTPEDFFKCLRWKKSPLIRPTTQREQEGSWSIHETPNPMNPNTCKKSSIQPFTNAEKRMIRAKFYPPKSSSLLADVISKQIELK